MPQDFWIIRLFILIFYHQSSYIVLKLLILSGISSFPLIIIFIRQVICNKISYKLGIWMI